jgi:hypothetical protein
MSDLQERKRSQGRLVDFEGIRNGESCGGIKWASPKWGRVAECRCREQHAQLVIRREETPGVGWFVRSIV